MIIEIEYYHKEKKEFALKKAAQNLSQLSNTLE